MLVAAFPACENKTSPALVGAPTPVRVAFAAVVLNLPMFVAQDRDMAKEHGLTLDAKLFANANDMVTALVAGEVDVALSVSLVPVLNLEAQRPGTLRVFSYSKMTSEHPFDSLLVQLESPIRELADLKGKKVAVFQGTTATNLLCAFLKRKGLDASAVRCVPLPPTSHLPALESGSVDALFAYEPTVTIALQTGQARRLFGSVYADLQPNSPIAVCVVSRKFEREHPEAIKQLIAMYDQAIGVMRAEPVQCANSLTAHTSVPADIAAKVSVIDSTLATETRAAPLQQLIDLMVEAGEVPQRVFADSLISQSQ